MANVQKISVLLLKPEKLKVGILQQVPKSDSKVK